MGGKSKKRLIKALEFAHEVGVSHAAISKLKKTRLAPAFEGRWINANHPVAIEYANDKHDARTGGKSSPVPAKYRQKDPTEDIAEYADMTLRELIAEFGTENQFLDWLKALKSIEDIEEKRLKNAASRGELVNKNFLILVLDTVNETHRKLLTDGMQRLGVDIHGKANAGANVAELSEHCAKIVSGFLDPMKHKIARQLKNG